MKMRITYQPGTSTLHVLHPLVKFLWLISLTALIFLFEAWFMVLPLLALLVAAFPLLGFMLRDLRGMRALIMTALMIGLLQIIFVREGEPLAQVGPLLISRVGAERGVYLASRFLMVVLLSYLFVLTTSPNDLAYALMQAGLPYRFGFTLVTALRLIPIFEEEALTVYRAQLVRGVSYHRRSLRGLVHDLRSMLLPMLVSAMSRVDSLAISMEGRSFGRYGTRTYYHQQDFRRRDWLAVGGLVAVVAFLIVLPI